MPFVEVTPGQASEAPRLAPPVDRTIGRVGPVDEPVADRAFDGDPQRGAWAGREVAPVIPSESNRAEPRPFDPQAYRGRNKVERLFAKLKGFRRVATRYDQRKAVFLGVVHLALGFIRPRRLANVNRP